ncbi:MAG: PLP-dependent aminotransferase family protein [Thermoleophilia bacterium]|nr:PLP-dependent aminotransferase family protein [Thermoleophilia bacterium]
MEASVVERELSVWSDRFAARARADSGEIAAILALAARADVISFAGGIPDPVTFPRGELAAILAELAERNDVTAFQYGPTEGLASTRAWLRERLARLEGRAPADEELTVTSGGIEALELLGKAFLEPGDTAIVEGPTYLGAIMSFRAFGAEVVAVALDDGGLAVDELEAQLRSGRRPKLLYTIPDHQNPAGVTLVAERRAALVDLARRYGFLLVEDVAYRELSWERERPPTLWATAPDAVVQIGTFSKTFMPGTRLGWACGPAEVVAKLVWGKQLTDQCAGSLGQRLLEEYGRRGLLDDQIRRAAQLYGARAHALLAALEQHFRGGAHWTRPTGGFFSWLTLPAADSVELAARAADAGVAVVPGVPFYPDGRGRDALRLSFSRAHEDEIATGIARLAELVA